jgi:hypothetical protein
MTITPSPAKIQISSMRDISGITPPPTSADPQELTILGTAALQRCGKPILEPALQFAEKP